MAWHNSPCRCRCRWLVREPNTSIHSCVHYCLICASFPQKIYGKLHLYALYRSIHAAHCASQAHPADQCIQYSHTRTPRPHACALHTLHARLSGAPYCRLYGDGPGLLLRRFPSPSPMQGNKRNRACSRGQQTIRAHMKREEIHRNRHDSFKFSQINGEIDMYRLRSRTSCTENMLFIVRPAQSCPLFRFLRRFLGCVSVALLYLGILPFVGPSSVSVCRYPIFRRVVSRKVRCRIINYRQLIGFSNTSSDCICNIIMIE